MGNLNSTSHRTDRCMTAYVMPIQFDRKPVINISAFFLSHCEIILVVDWADLWICIFCPIYIGTVYVFFTHVVSPATVQPLVHGVCPSRLCTHLAVQSSLGFSTAIMRTQCYYHATYVINVITYCFPLYQLSAGIKTTQTSPAGATQEKFGFVPACPLLSPRYFHAD